MNQRDRFDNEIIHWGVTGKQNSPRMCHKPHFFSILSGRCSYKVKHAWLGMLCAIAFLGKYSAQAQVPASTKQLLVTIAPDWNSHRASMQCYQRESERSGWRPAFQVSWPVLLGRNGLAWGRGIFTPPDDGRPDKQEKDGKAPAGIFKLGSVYGYEAAPPDGTRWPYVQVGAYDAWIDDPKLPHYNEHVRVEAGQVPEWFEGQKMRLGDKAYHWLLEIRHNTDPATPGYGSAIFFHVRRGPDRPTTGCTTMAVEDLETVIRWLRPEANPCYVLLPKDEFEKLRDAWKLPWSAGK
jgi:L,D-peptidoglycan transpeptidase YkuD (ErfK/YbiS/YcfS/YnhG family)